MDKKFYTKPAFLYHTLYCVIMICFILLLNLLVKDYINSILLISIPFILLLCLKLIDNANKEEENKILLSEINDLKEDINVYKENEIEYKKAIQKLEKQIENATKNLELEKLKNES